MDRDELCRRLEQIRDDLANEYRVARSLAGLRRGVDVSHQRMSELITTLWRADDFTIETGIGR